VPSGRLGAAYAPDTDRAALPVTTLQMLQSVGALEKAKEQGHALPTQEKILTLYLGSVLQGAESTAP